MSKTKILMAVAAILGIFALAGPTPATASLITQFSSVSDTGGTLPGAFIAFTGGPSRTITFPGAPSGYDFIINQSDAPSMIGIQGNINGTFTVGTISSLGSLQTAPVSGTGTFSLTDSSGYVLSADLVWDEIFTYGGSGGLNPSNSLNLTNWTYAGADPVFMAIVNGTERNETLSFQFSPGKSLTQLMGTGAYNQATYSGAFSMLPEPGTLLMLLAGSAVLRLRRQRKR
jgi:hypothetical protein